MLTHQYAETAMGEAQRACTELTKKCIAGICQQSDKQALVDDNIGIFRAPHNFDFQPHKGDEVSMKVDNVASFLCVECFYSVFRYTDLDLRFIFDSIYRYIDLRFTLYFW